MTRKKEKGEEKARLGRDPLAKVAVSLETAVPLEEAAVSTPRRRFLVTINRVQTARMLVSVDPDRVEGVGVGGDAETEAVSQMVADLGGDVLDSLFENVEKATQFEFVRTVPHAAKPADDDFRVVLGCDQDVYDYGGKEAEDGLLGR